MIFSYQRWMHDWETRLTMRDTNRVVRPLDWGIDWVDEGWPCVNGNLASAHLAPERFLRELNRELIAHSDEFFAYEPPSDFRLEAGRVLDKETGAVAETHFLTQARGVSGHDLSRAAGDGTRDRGFSPCPSTPGGETAVLERPIPARLKPYPDTQTVCETGPTKNHAQFLRFTSAAPSPYPVNNRVNARWFPAKGKRAVVVIPQWNADGESHNGLCRIFQWLGIASLRLSIPYHDVRKPEELERADYAVSANIGRTMAATRQGVIDIRSCFDWLESQGYTELGIMGTSLGSCYAFLAAAHDRRIRVGAYNHASTYVGDVVWT
ncbi:MAG TPA: alpha/beta hydrolase family protein, partial [Anaerolineae bacterium]